MAEDETFATTPRTAGQLGFSSFGLVHFHRAPAVEGDATWLSLLERGERIVVPADPGVDPSSFTVRGDRVALSFTDFIGAPAKVVVGRVAAAPSGLALTESIVLARSAWKLSFDPSGERIACTNSSRGLWTHDTRTGEPVGFLRTSSFLCASSFDADGRSLVALATSGELLAWRLGTPAPYAKIALEGFGLSLARSPDGEALAVRTTKEVVVVRREPLSVVWRAAPMRRGSEHVAPSANVAWVDDERFLVPFHEHAFDPEQPFRGESFVYLFDRDAPDVRERLRAPAWRQLVADPARGRLAVSTATEVRVHTLSSLLATLRAADGL